MTARIPFVFYGDGPRLPSGLGRIARDILLRLLPEEEELGIVVHQVGVDPPDGWHWQGWPFWGFQPDSHDQGRAAMEQVVEELSAQYGHPPIIFMIMDPSRCYDLTRMAERRDGVQQQLDARFWAYFPIDSENVQGRLSGPAAESIWTCDRLLGYGRYGARVLRSTVEAMTAKVLARPSHAPRMVQVPPISYLPHGLDTSFRPGVPLEETGPAFTKWRLNLPGDVWVLGCVATNQARKDLSLLFGAASLLKREGASVAVWLHTDRLTNAWDVGQLCLDFGFERPEVCVSLTDTPLTDEQLAARYWASDVTLGVGLGEGFGYPLVESLACGTPVVHGAFAGGMELLPRRDWLVDPVAWRLESCYAVKRPVFRPEDMAGAIALAAAWKRGHPALCAAYCRGAVSYLSWDQLWPRWRAWIRNGLIEERGVYGQRRAGQYVQPGTTGRPHHAADQGVRPVPAPAPGGRRGPAPGEGGHLLAGPESRSEYAPVSPGGDGGALASRGLRDGGAGGRGNPRPDQGAGRE